MELPSPELVRQPISNRELERRWSETRKAMAARGIDCLVMQSHNQWLGGHVRYFTDFPAEHAYPVTILFPADDEMTMVNHGARTAAPVPPGKADRGIKQKIGLPYFLSLNYTNTMDAETVVSYLRGRGDRRVGVVGKAFMSAAFHEYLKENSAGVELVDATDLIDEIRAVKSPEEIEFIKKAVWIHDAAFACVPAIVRPGKKEYEIRSELQRLLVDMGSEEQLIIMGSAPPNQVAGHKPVFYQNRTLQPGDQLMLMLEVNGPGGFYAELGRTICLGEPPKVLQDAWLVALEAQRRTAAQLKPGAHPADVFKSHNEFMENHGYPGEKRIYAHGQGYDLVERPAIREEEPMLLKANMNIAVHPLAASSTAYAFCCDNYLVGETGAIRLSQTPLEILIV
jgi:Xaa-Pro aminopeptidase